MIFLHEPFVHFHWQSKIHELHTLKLKHAIEYNADVDIGAHCCKARGTIGGVADDLNQCFKTEFEGPDCGGNYFSRHILGALVVSNPLLREAAVSVSVAECIVKQIKTVFVHEVLLELWMFFLL